MNKWISVEGGNLPPKTSREQAYKRYIVRVVCENSNFFTKPFVTTALYDDYQKIWYLDEGVYLNALCDVDGTPLGDDYITHWMPLPEQPTASSLAED